MYRVLDKIRVHTNILRNPAKQRVTDQASRVCRHKPSTRSFRLLGEVASELQRRRPALRTPAVIESCRIMCEAFGFRLRRLWSQTSAFRVWTDGGYLNDLSQPLVSGTVPSHTLSLPGSTVGPQPLIKSRYNKVFECISESTT